MRKRSPTILRPQRRSYRFQRVDASMLDHVLKVVNGEVRSPARYEPERSEIRAVLDRIIGYCDRVEGALEGIEHCSDPWEDLIAAWLDGRRDVSVEEVLTGCIGKKRGQWTQAEENRVWRCLRALGWKLYDQSCQRLRKSRNRSARIRRAQEIAYSGLLRIFALDPTKPREFKVCVMPRRSSGKDPRDAWKPNVLPPAEEMFRVTNLFIWPPGDIGVQLYWEFYQGIIQLDDLRRLRKCSGYLHSEPYYFLGKKVQRRENYFCGDQCRSDFNYKKLMERKER